MSKMILIRHGETEMAGRFCGHSDPCLNAAGEDQAIALAEIAAKLGIVRIYTSDLRRATQTAVTLAQRMHVEVDICPMLREINFGLWEGLNWNEIEERFPQDASRWIKKFPLHSAPQGETYAEFTARIDAAFASLFEASKEQTTAIVTHRGVMSYALAKYFGFTQEEAWIQTAPFCAMVVVDRHLQGGMSACK